MKYEIGKRIRMLRERAGLSQKELATRLEISNARLCNWENGSSRPDADTIYDICRALNVGASELLNTPSPEKQLSPEALAVAYAYDSMSDYGKAIIGTVMQIELKPSSLDPVTIYRAMED